MTVRRVFFIRLPIRLVLAAAVASTRIGEINGRIVSTRGAVEVTEGIELTSAGLLLPVA